MPGATFAVMDALYPEFIPLPAMSGNILNSVFGGDFCCAFLGDMVSAIYWVLSTSAAKNALANCANWLSRPSITPFFGFSFGDLDL